MTLTLKDSACERWRWSPWCVFPIKPILKLWKTSENDKIDTEAPPPRRWQAIHGEPLEHLTGIHDKTHFCAKQNVFIHEHTSSLRQDFFVNLMFCIRWWRGTECPHLPDHCWNNKYRSLTLSYIAHRREAWGPSAIKRPHYTINTHKLTKDWLKSDSGFPIVLTGIVAWFCDVGRGRQAVSERAQQALRSLANGHSFHNLTIFMSWDMNFSFS